MQDLGYKMVAKAAEISTAPVDKLASELVDMLEIIYVRAELAGISRHDLKTLRAEKAAQRGSFTLGIFLSRVSCPVGDRWDHHFAAHPGCSPTLKLFSSVSTSRKLV